MLGYLKYLLGSIIMAAALAGISWLIAWRVLDARILSVQSGSMAPAFNKGDLLIDIRPAHLKTGDTISYPSLVNPGQIVSHRIIKLSGSTLTTKGDGLAAADPAIPASVVLGRTVTVIPKAGYAFDQLYRPAGLIAMVYAPALIITVTELWLLTGRYGYRPYRFTQTV